MIAVLLFDLISSSLELEYIGSEILCSAYSAAAIVAATLVMRHSPHDVIEDVRVAEGAEHRKTVFVVSRHNLLRSSDGGEWKRLTQGLGPYKLSSLAASPAFATDHTLFVGSLGGGVFRSRDGGANWTACNHGIGDAHIVLLGISPDFAQSGALIALGHNGVLYRTGDGGDTWKGICSPELLSADSPTADDSGRSAEEYWLSPVHDAGEAWKKWHRTVGITCVAFASDAILVGTSEGTMYVSLDQGVSWKRFARVSASGRITCIAVAPGGSLDGCVFVGTEYESVFRVSHAGTRVERAGHARGLSRVTAMGFLLDSQGNLNLLACSWDKALFVSRDQGKSWVRKAAGLTKNLQADERRFGAPHFSGIAVAPGNASLDVYVGGFDGLFRTQDLDNAWESVETLPLGIVSSIAVSSDLEKSSTLAVATYGAGVYVLPNGATSWQIRNRGLDTLRLGVIRFSPDYMHDRTVFTVAEGQVLRSIDSEPWQATRLLPASSRRSIPVRVFAGLRTAQRLASIHVNKRSLNRLKSLFQLAAVHTGGRISNYVFPTVIAFSPGYREDRTILVGTRAHGVFRSADGGRSFSQVWDGHGRFVFSLAVSPGYPREGLLYASLSDGIYCSRDAASTWERLESGPPFRSARLVLSPAFDVDNTLFVGGYRGLWRSSDRGGHWHTQPIGAEFGPTAIGGIALSPTFGLDGLMLVYAHGKGLHRSTNRGESFARLRWSDREGDHAFTPLRCFPDTETLFQFSPTFAEDRIIVAASMDRIYISHDAGTTWASLPKPTRYEGSRAEIVYRGNWTLVFDDAFGAQCAYRSCSPLAEAKLSFFGAGISWVGTRGPDHGIANVYVDDKLRATVDLYSPERQTASTAFATTLPPGRHHITVQVQRAKNSKSTSREVVIDAFEVGPSG
jgi:photosystem II stability/assembly factor-like uncharacterized protein